MSKPVNYWELGASAQQQQQQIPDDLDDAAMMEMFMSKKKKKKKQALALEESLAEAKEAGLDTVDLSEDTYDDLLRRLYDKMGVVQDVHSASLRLKPPKVESVGSKKSAWVNFRKSCETLNRPEDHLSLFLSSELGCIVSTTAEGALLFRGNFAANKIESCLRKYIELYVKCAMCRSSQTHLQKDSGSRIMMMKCDMCMALRSVETIRTGFHAITKADRKKAALE